MPLFIFRVFRILGLRFESTILGFLFRIWEFLGLIWGNNDIYGCFLSILFSSRQSRGFMVRLWGFYGSLGFTVVSSGPYDDG